MLILQDSFKVSEPNVTFFPFAYTYNCRIKQMDDRTLLKQYVENGSHVAFAKLVDRHLKMVYSTCFRDVNDSALAEDLTQTVFILLARKASGLHKDTPIGGWLFNAARFVSKNAIRQEMRRRVSTENTMRLMEDSAARQQEWDRIEPQLNAGLASLSVLERETVLMRYYDNLSAREIGDALAISEESARKRLSRAIEKLRTYFKGHGASTTSTSLSILLTQNMITRVPESCHIAVLHAVQNLTVSPVSPGLGSAHFELIQKGAYFAMQTSKYKFLIAAAALLLLGGLGFTGYKGWSYYHPAGSAALVVPGSFVDLSGAQTSALGAQGTSTSVDHAAITAKLVEFANGFNSHNVSQLSAIFAPDLTVTSPHQPPMTRDQLVASGSREFDSRPNEKMYISVQSMEISGDSATSKDTRRMTDGGNVQDDTMTWAKREGNWEVTAISNP